MPRRRNQTTPANRRVRQPRRRAQLQPPESELPSGFFARCWRWCCGHVAKLRFIEQAGLVAIATVAVMVWGNYLIEAQVELTEKTLQETQTQANLTRDSLALSRNEFEAERSNRQAQRRIELVRVLESFDRLRAREVAKATAVAKTLPETQKALFEARHNGTMPGVSVPLRAALEVLVAEGVELSDVDLRYLNLERADLANATLRYGHLKHSWLKFGNLTEADLSGANLRNADLKAALLIEADLWRADLRGAYLMEADLSRANLRGAVLWDANLHESNLRGADLSGAVLHSADAACIKLYGAYISEAYFTNARNLKQSYIDSACWDGVNPPILPAKRFCPDRYCEWNSTIRKTTEIPRPTKVRHPCVGPRNQTSE